MEIVILALLWWAVEMTNNKNQQTMKAEYDIQKMSVSELTNLKVELEKRADYNAPILDEIEEILTTKNNNQ
jgi:hypothetical protein